MLFALSVVWQQSPPPVPTPGKAAHLQNDKTSPDQKRGSADKSSADELVSAINRLTAAVAAANQKQPAAPSKEKSSDENWLKINAGLVTLFTCALAVLAFFQWRAMHRQADYLRSAERAHIDLDIVGNDSRYTVMIANYGKSIATIVGYKMSHSAYPTGLSDRELLPDNATTRHEDGMEMNQILPPTNGMTKELWSFDFGLFLNDEVRRKNPTIIVSVKVSYVDIFGLPHETEVTYKSHGPTLKNLPEYNSYT
jgi:hypothetical protein